MYVQAVCSHFTAKPIAKMKSSKARNFPAHRNIEGEAQVATISDSDGVRGQPLESGHGPCILDSSGKCPQLCPFLRANEQEIPETQATDQNSNPQADNKEEQKDKSKEPPEPPEQKKNRCHKCGKKLGLTGAFPCRCGGIYCAVHRYSDRHECSFDYREMGASEIRRNNPVTVAKKLPEI